MLTAVIDEDKCIGCTKCLDACPFDSIIGAHNYMHSVITAECIGCKKCVPACPVNCIEMHPLDNVIKDIKIEHPLLQLESKTIDVREQVKFVKQRASERKMRLEKSSQQIINAIRSSSKDKILARLEKIKHDKKG